MSKEKTVDMTVGEPFKLLISFSIPVLLGDLFQQFYNMCDTIIVGKLLGENALASVGCTGPMNFLILGFVFGITTGFTVITAQRFGAQDIEGLKRSVAANIVLNLIFSFFITIFASLLVTPILHLINTPDEIFNTARLYITIIFLGTSANALYNCCACLLRAVGDSKTPFYFLVIGTVFNIILDYVLIKFTPLKIAGAALATVASQAIAGVLCLFWIGRKFPVLKVTRKDFVFPKGFLKQHLNIGVNMGFQFSITAIGVVVLQGALNKFGALKIAAYTAATKVEQMTTVEATVLGVAMSTFAGQNLGAKKIERINEGMIKSSVLSVILAVLSGLVAWFFGDQMTSLFLNSKTMDPASYAEVIKTARLYLRICAVFYPSLFLLFTFRETLQGLGRGFWPLVSGAMELLSRVAVAYTLPRFMGFTGICCASAIAWLLGMIPLVAAYFVIIRKLQKSLSACD